MFGFLPSPCSTCLPARAAVYRSHFCGLSNCFAGEYGPLARFFTNRDATFLSLLSRSGPEEEGRQTISKRCCNPVGKPREMVHGWPSQYAAAVTICGASVKLEDNVDDETGWRSQISRAGLAAMRRWTKQAKHQLNVVGFPVEEVESSLAGQAQREVPGADWEQVAEPTAVSYGHIFANCTKGETIEALRGVGSRLGRTIYLWDALVDRESDAERGRYNPLSSGEDCDEARSWLHREFESLKEAWNGVPSSFRSSLADSILIEGVGEKLLPWFNGLSLEEIEEEKEERRRKKSKERRGKWYEGCDPCCCDCGDCGSACDSGAPDCCDCCPCDC